MEVTLLCGMMITASQLEQGMAMNTVGWALEHIRNLNVNYVLYYALGRCYFAISILCIV